MEEVVGVDLSVGVPKRYEEPESCGSAADFLLGVEMERDPPGREEVEVDVLMAVETDLLSNHNDSTKCQSSYPATSAYIRNCRILLLCTTKTLAAYQLRKETSWKQLHTDETGRRQKQLVNVVINIINESGHFKSICLSGSIIAEDSTAEEQSRAIIAFFGEAGQLLQEWKDVTLEMFPQRQDLIDMIPDPSDMSPTKLLVVVWCQRIPAKQLN